MPLQNLHCIKYYRRLHQRISPLLPALYAFLRPATIHIHLSPESNRHLLDGGGGATGTEQQQSQDDDATMRLQIRARGYFNVQLGTNIKC